MAMRRASISKREADSRIAHFLIVFLMNGEYWLETDFNISIFPVNFITGSSFIFDMAEY